MLICTLSGTGLPFVANAVMRWRCVYVAFSVDAYKIKAMNVWSWIFVKTLLRKHSISCKRWLL